MSDIRYCERCGAPLIPGSRSCDNCGMQQSSRQQQTDIRPPYHPGHSIPRVNRGQGQNQNYSQQQPVSQPGQRRNPRLIEPEDGGRRQRAQQPMPDRSQPQTVSQSGQRRNSRPAEPEDGGRRQRVQQPIPNRSQHMQQPMPNRSQPQSVPQPGQRQNPRPYRVDDGWEQSWERMDEDERRFTPAQCVLIGIIVVSLAALLAFGIFWVGLRSSDRSARDRIGAQPTAVNQEARPADQNAQPADASLTGGTSANQNAQPADASPTGGTSADQNAQPAGASPTGGTSADQKTSPEESPDQNTQPDDGTADIIILN